MSVCVSPKLHTHTKHQLRSPPAFPTQGTVAQSHNVKVSSQGVMSGNKANNHPGLRPIKGKQSGLNINTRARDQPSSLSLSASKSLPQCHVLFIHPALNFLLYTLPRDSQGRFWSHKMVFRTPPCELIGNFISTYSRMSGDPKESHRVVGRLWLTPS
jgi:hypothetical protein